jgi:membrane protein DedA with SNARE-associated domain
VPLALLSIPRHGAYVALAALVGFEASGVPVPGETALIAASVLAGDGHLSIQVVIAIAAAAAIVGDNVGYWLGSRFGRRLLTRPGRTYEHRRAALERGERLFARHGAKAVFFGRWIAGLRVWASWLAGMTSMPWRRFLVWNALGGVGWAVCFGLLGYFVGTAASHVVERVGLAMAIVVASGLLAAYGLVRWRLRRRAVRP